VPLEAGKPRGAFCIQRGGSMGHKEATMVREKVDLTRPHILGQLLVKAAAIAEERAEKEKGLWYDALLAVSEALHLGDHLDFAKEGEGKDPVEFILEAAEWHLKRLKKDEFAPQAVELVRAALTEALQGFTPVVDGLVVAPAREMRFWYGFFRFCGDLGTWFGKMSLADCDLFFYTNNPGAFSLWILMDEEGKAAACANCLKGVEVEDLEGNRHKGQRVLDRIYAEGSVRDEATAKLIELAKEQGVWYRAKQNFKAISPENPLIGPEGRKAVLARAPLGRKVQDLSLDFSRDGKYAYFNHPLMDTFRYLWVREDMEVVLSTLPPRKGPYYLMGEGWDFNNKFRAKLAEAARTGGWEALVASDEALESGVACSCCKVLYRVEDEPLLGKDEGGRRYCTDCAFGCDRIRYGTCDCDED